MGNGSTVELTYSIMFQSPFQSPFNSSAYTGIQNRAMPQATSNILPPPRESVAGNGLLGGFNEQQVYDYINKMYGLQGDEAKELGGSQMRKAQEVRSQALHPYKHKNYLPRTGYAQGNQTES